MTNLPINHIDQADFLANPSHDAQMINALSLNSVFGIHALRLLDIPESRYWRVRNVGHVFGTAELYKGVTRMKLDLEE